MKNYLLKILSLFLIFSCLSPNGFGERMPELPQGPLILTSVQPEQLNPNYWISRLQNPDQVLKTPDQIEVFNRHIRAMINTQKDIFAMGKNWPGKQIKDQIQLEYNAVRGRGLLNLQNEVTPKSYFDENIKPLLQLEKIPDNIPLKWGTATRATSVRSLPAEIKLLEKPNDWEFDMLQFSLIKLWTPVAVYHQSKDGVWYYIQAPYARGWVKAKDIAIFSTRDELKKYAQAKSFFVVTGESASIYSDPSLTQILQRPSMGTILPIAAPQGRVVWMPFRKEDGSKGLRKGYLSQQADVNHGFLPYTQRNIIKQSFKLLGARYGWGGSFNGRDCSGFTHDVFLPFGIDMPRGSRDQGYIGTQLDHFEPFEEAEVKAVRLHEATPAVTLLRMPMHMMIYLGQENGQFYVIHSTWAERISMTSDEKNRINQVVVSDLNLNGKSRIGSLFDRIISINEVN